MCASGASRGVPCARSSDFMGRLTLISVGRSTVQSNAERRVTLMKMRISKVLGLCILLLQGLADTVTEAQDASFYMSGCKLNEAKSPMLKLKRHLFCDYDTGVRPTTNHLVGTNVTIGFMPQSMDFDEMSGTMSLHSWLQMSWQDGHLNWTPEDFEGLAQIHVKSDELWLPDISLYNSGDMPADQTGIPTTDCVVSHDGFVVCVPAVKHVSTCETDFTRWPFDRHNCVLKLGSWAHTGEEIYIRLDKVPVQMASYVPNRVWDLTYDNSVEKGRKFPCCPNDTFPLVLVKFAVSRHSTMMHKVFVTPAIVLTVLTLTVMWLDSRSIERTAVASVNFICHLLCIIDLHWQLPYNGTSAPSILLFYRDSLILATFALMLTVFLRKLQDTRVSVPGWIGSTTALVLSNRAARFLILSEEETKRSVTESNSSDQDNSDPPKPSPHWRHLAGILEWTSFFSVVFTYLVILLTLLS